jgi:quercetin dioxygenase-like cupin family protein
MKRSLLVSLTLLAFTTLAHAADAPKITVTPIFSSNTTATGQKINVPAHPNVVVTQVTFAPGAALPVHKHPYPHYVYVLEGTLTVTNVETGKVYTVTPGQFFIEMNDTWHFGQNNGTTPLKIIGIDQMPEGVKSNMVVQKTK